jgi:ribosomal protein L11 methyltransferase
MNYQAYHFEVDSEQKEILLAFLSELPFEMMEETEKGWTGFVAEGEEDADLDQRLTELQQRVPFQWTNEIVPQQNWNAIWESSFEPIVIGNFCAVRADFHAAIPEVEHELVINPKMAFGTGHHATTYMMIEMMEDMEWKGKSVLDFGCGTGILAILAHRLGAEPITAIDIDPNSVENTLENAKINQSEEGLEVLEGSLPVTAGNRYDRILANINRNVLLDTIFSLYDQTFAPGTVLLSGILVEDRQVVSEKAKKAGFKLEKVLEQGGWICMRLHRPL